MSMFCFQCEQTAFHKACTKKGVCGKEPDTANLQDELTSSVIELANCEEINDENTKHTHIFYSLLFFQRYFLIDVKNTLLYN